MDSKYLKGEWIAPKSYYQITILLQVLFYSVNTARPAQGAAPNLCPIFYGHVLIRGDLQLHDMCSYRIPTSVRPIFLSLRRHNTNAILRQQLPSTAAAAGGGL
jgi:hypothetical protein